MKFRYTEYELGNGKTMHRPTLPLTLHYGNVVIPVADALVDTGADRTLLPLELGIAFGFRFDLQKDGDVWSGAGGGKFRVYFAPAPIHFTLQQKAFRDIQWTGLVCFTLDQPTILLGHKGCLEYLDITLRGKKREIEVHAG